MIFLFRTLKLRCVHVWHSCCMALVIPRKVLVPHMYHVYEDGEKPLSCRRNCYKKIMHAWFIVCVHLCLHVCDLDNKWNVVVDSSYTELASCTLLRVGSHYGQTSRGEAFGPMKMHKCPKSVLSAFTLEAEVQRTSSPKEPRWQHF